MTNIWYVLENIPFAHMNNVSCVCWVNFFLYICIFQIQLLYSIVQVLYFHNYFLIDILSIAENVLLKFPGIIVEPFLELLKLGLCYFSLQICQCLLHIVCSVGWCIYVYNHYILLIKSPFINI